MRSFKVVFATACVLAAATFGFAATLEVSFPTQVTSNTFFERDHYVPFSLDYNGCL